MPWRGFTGSAFSHCLLCLPQDPLLSFHLCKKNKGSGSRVFKQSLCMLWPDPSPSGSAKQGQWGPFAVLWLKSLVVLPPVFWVSLSVKCRAFEAGVTGKCSCSVTGPCEPPLPSPSHTPGSLDTEFVRLLLMARQSAAVVCRGAREEEPGVLWRVGEREKPHPCSTPPAWPSCVSRKVSHFWAGFLFWLLCLWGNK